MSRSDPPRRFANLEAPTGKSLREVLWWLLTKKREPWPRWVDDPPVSAPPGHDDSATFVGHSTFLLRVAGHTLLTDPIWSERASPLSWAGPRRVRRPGLSFDSLPAIDVVLISHNHYDHMDLPTLRRLQERFRPLFLTGLGNRDMLRRRGLERVEELSWWQTCSGRDGLAITFTPAQHFSRRGLFDMSRSLWGGFLLRAGDLRLFFAGDTGYAAHLREIARRAGPIDVSLLPIGAYEPRWFMKVNHMNPAEAVQAHLDLESALSIAMHFGTFQLTDEGIDEPVRALADSLRERAVAPESFLVPAFGQSIPLRKRGNTRPGDGLADQAF